MAVTLPNLCLGHCVHTQPRTTSDTLFSPNYWTNDIHVFLAVSFLRVVRGATASQEFEFAHRLAPHFLFAYLNVYCIILAAYSALLRKDTHTNTRNQILYICFLLCLCISGYLCVYLSVYHLYIYLSICSQWRASWEHFSATCSHLTENMLQHHEPAAWPAPKPPTK